jgi:DNA-binding transcriptional ArsR family regulator
MVNYSTSRLDRTFAALADPTRRRILAHLARGERNVSELARPHAMSLPAISKHLRVLEKAGLLLRRRYGRVHTMQLQTARLGEATAWIEYHRKFWEGSLDRLASFLEKTNKGKKHADKDNRQTIARSEPRDRRAARAHLQRVDRSRATARVVRARDAKTHELIADARVGGNFRWTLDDCDNESERMTVSGEYLELVPKRKIVFTCGAATARDQLDPVIL